MAMIKFKGKIVTLEYADGTIACRRIKIPTLGRQHCDMHAFRTHSKFGSYANSDMFNGMLARIKRDTFGSSEFLKLDNIPDGVSIDTSGFLAVVSFDV